MSAGPFLPEIHVTEHDPVRAALADGDRWLSAYAAAIHLGMMDSSGGVKLRSFLDLAATPTFPEPLRIGKNRMWRKSEIDTWAMEQRRVSRAA